MQDGAIQEINCKNRMLKMLKKLASLRKYFMGFNVHKKINVDHLL